jgi:hypothetical protein
MLEECTETMHEEIKEGDVACEQSDRSAELLAARSLIVQIAALQRLLRIYNLNNAAVTQAADSLIGNLSAFFEELPSIEIRLWRDCIFINGDRLRCDVSNFVAYKSMIAQAG